MSIADSQRRARRPRTGGSADKPLVASDVETRFRRKEEKAFKIVFAIYFERVCRCVSTLFRLDLDDAEDVAQRAFIRLWDAAERLPTHESLETCIFRYARSEALEFVRRTDHRLTLLTAHDPTTDVAIAPLPDDWAHAALLWRDVRRALTRLPQVCRDAFVSCRVHGWTYKEVAEASGVRPNTTKSNVANGEKHLRRLLGRKFM